MNMVLFPLKIFICCVFWSNRNTACIIFHIAKSSITFAVDSSFMILKSKIRRVIVFSLLIAIEWKIKNISIERREFFYILERNENYK